MSFGKFGDSIDGLRTQGLESQKKRLEAVEDNRQFFEAEFMKLNGWVGKEWIPLIKAAPVEPRFENLIKNRRDIDK